VEVGGWRVDVEGGAWSVEGGGWRVEGWRVEGGGCAVSPMKEKVPGWQEAHEDTPQSIAYVPC